MIGRLLVGLLAAATLSTTSSAQTLRFNDLEGHSVVSEYTEEVMTRRFGPYRATWKDRVYFSTKGRIFHRFNRQSSIPGMDRHAENVSDDEGRIEGRGAAFRWTGDGIVREWTNPRGIHIRQSISISPSGAGFSCRLSVERSTRRGRAYPISQLCRVIKGNVLAG